MARDNEHTRVRVRMLMHLIPWRELDLKRERLAVDGCAAARDTAACVHACDKHALQSL